MAIDWTKPIQTLDGRVAKVLEHSENSRVTYVAVKSAGQWHTYPVFTDTGSCWVTTINDARNIINVPEKRTVRMTFDVWSDGDVRACVKDFDSTYLAEVIHSFEQDITFEI